MKNDEYIIDCTRALKGYISRPVILQKTEEFFETQYFQSYEEWDYKTFPLLCIRNNLISGLAKEKVAKNDLVRQEVIDWYDIYGKVNSKTLASSLPTLEFKEGSL